MTDKQKKAIGILNRLHGQGPKAGDLLTDEEYYALMDFVIGDGQQQQLTYIPYAPFVPDTTTPQDPLAPPYRVTCNKQDLTLTDMNRTMLRPQNIMIGDWVNVKNYHWDGSPLAAQVDGIIKKHGTYYLQFNDSVSAEIDVCEPIKLTFEILEKNGWDVDGMYARLTLDGMSYIEWYKHEGVLRKYYVYRESGAKELIACTPPGLVYVHELQNTLNEWGIWKEVAL